MPGKTAEPITPRWGRLLGEMTVIVLIAFAAGIAWNRQMLSDARTGRLTAQAAAPDATEQEPIPLPAGLMQVKDYFDRQEALFVDARDSGAFAEGHIRGAFSLPVGEARERLAHFREKVPPGSVLVVYCNGYGCHDSMTLAEMFLKAGYRRVYVFEGGYPEWKDAGYPVAKGQS